MGFLSDPAEVHRAPLWVEAFLVSGLEYFSINWDFHNPNSLSHFSEGNHEPEKRFDVAVHLF